MKAIAVLYAAWQGGIHGPCRQLCVQARAHLRLACYAKRGRDSTAAGKEGRLQDPPGMAPRLKVPSAGSSRFATQHCLRGSGPDLLYLGDREDMEFQPVQRGRPHRLAQQVDFVQGGSVASAPSEGVFLDPAAGT